MRLRQYMMGCTTCGDLSFNSIPVDRFNSEQEAIDNFRACIDLLAEQFNATVRYFTEGSTHYWHIESGDQLHVYIFQWLPVEMDAYYQEREDRYNEKHSEPDLSASIRNFINNLGGSAGLNLN